MEIEFPKLTLVIGGAASGKSRFAERLVMSCNHPRSYIATAQAFDKEMVAKVAKHKAQRGKNWETCEEPLAPWNALSAIASTNVVLLDCATFWLSNILMGDHDLNAAKDKLFSGLRDFGGSVVIVTNEVGQGVVPENPLVRRFRQEQGELNQELAAMSELVVFVTAGLPLALKGILPEVLQ